MSAVRILVLGVVRGLGQAHGYQVRRELMTWRADAWAHVAPASIYQALRTLAKRGLVDEVGTESGGAGPERLVYRITPDGETDFLRLVRDAISDPAGGDDALSAAFAFLDLLPRAEVATLLDHRVRALRAELLRVDPPPDGSAGAADYGKPPQVAALLQLTAAKVRAEVDWALELASRIRDGTFAIGESSTSKA